MLFKPDTVCQKVDAKNQMLNTVCQKKMPKITEMPKKSYHDLSGNQHTEKVMKY